MPKKERAGPSAARRSEQRRARTVADLFAAGVPIPEIARRLRLRPRSVRRVLRDVAGVLRNDGREEPKGENVTNRGPTRADFEEVRDLLERNLEVECGQTFARLMESGEIEKLAAERGVPYQDVFGELQDEVYAPLMEAQRRRAEHGGGLYSSPAIALDERGERRLDAEAKAHAARHGVDYATALGVVLAGGTRRVELEARSAPERPRDVDEAEAALDRKASEYARRHGVSYGVAFDAVLEGEERA